MLKFLMSTEKSYKKTVEIYELINGNAKGLLLALINIELFWK